MDIKILKFGGSSIADAKRIEHVVDIILHQKNDFNLAIVVSAIGGMTNLLEMMAIAASKGENSTDVYGEFVERHSQIIRCLFPKHHSRIINSLNPQFQQLNQVVSSINQAQHLEPKKLDEILSFGEYCSATILTEFLLQQNINADFIDARKVVITDNQFGNAFVYYQRTYNRIQSYIKNLNNIQIITGFIGASEHGETTTLGRSGSDYSASIFGAALNAKCIEIWTDTNGILTADPHMVQTPETIPHLTYEEAMELAHGGAKVIFPPTMIPALYKEIPIRIKNTFNPEHPGTLITKNRHLHRQKVVGISSLSNIALLRLQGAGMIGMKGLIGRIFTTLAEQNTNIILVSQTFSEHSICFAINPKKVLVAIEILKKEFEFEFKKHLIDKIVVEEHLSLVAVVGEGMRHTPGISGKIFHTLGRKNINVTAIAQGSSERNISFIIEDKFVKKTVKYLHRDLFKSSKEGADIFMVGVGNVGTELLNILHKSKPKNIFLKGVISSSKMYIAEDPIPPLTALESLSQSKTETDLDVLLNTYVGNENPKIIIDCTANEVISKKYHHFLEKGFSIVTANKIANTLSMEYYNQIREKAAEFKKQFLYETNVGAGLPVISTLQNLLITGDEIICIEGIFSGTLSYLFNTASSKIPFSKMVREANEKGFTEPDPRQDLDGMDAARKLLILARETGAKLELDDIKVESLLPKGSDTKETVDEFLTHLSKFDGEMKYRMLESEKKNQKLIFIGKFMKGKAEVKLSSVGENHPFSSTKGAENIFSFQTKRYHNQPIIIRGDGAGASVTAAGILSDIHRCLHSN